MYRPSGITVVTAGLAGIALFSVVWSHATRPTEPGPGQVSADGLPDLGAPMRLQPAAWRSWPAPAEEAPLAVPDEPAAQEAALPAVQGIVIPSAADMLSPASVAPPAAPEPLRGPVVRGVPEAAKAAPTQPTVGTVEAEPASKVAPMRLAGPKAETSEPPPSAVRGSEPAAHESERKVEAPPQSPPKFGPAIFKEIDRNGAF